MTDPADQSPQRTYVKPPKPFSEMTPDEFADFAEVLRQRILATRPPDEHGKDPARR